jgi:hypothetical protein
VGIPCCQLQLHVDVPHLAHLVSHRLTHTILIHASCGNECSTLKNLGNSCSSWCRLKTVAPLAACVVTKSFVWILPHDCKLQSDVASFVTSSHSKPSSNLDRWDPQKFAATS